MGTDIYSLNSTSLMNNTYSIDVFCTDLFVGPMVWAIICVPTACVGVSASVWLLWALNQRQRNGLSNNIYMLNLTTMDLIFNLGVLPDTLNYFFWRNVNAFYMFNAFYSFNLFGRPLFMAWICVECYLAVVHPTTYIKIKNGRHRPVTCVLVWVFTLVYGCVTAVVHNRKIEEVIFIISCGLSVPVIAFCDLSILYTLRKPDPSGRSEVHPQKQKAMQTIMNSLVMTLLSYFPFLVVSLFQHLIHINQQELHCNVYLPSSATATLGSTIMPLLHLGNLGRLQDIRLWARKCFSLCFSVKG